MSEWLLSTQRLVIGATVVLTGVVFLPALADPVNVVKLTLLAIGALVLLVLTLAGVLRQRRIALPTAIPAYAAAAFACALLLSAAVAPNTSRAVFGTYGRNSGLIAYAAALVVFFVGLRAWSAATGHVLAIALIVSGGMTATYGLFQYAGIDPIHWNNPFNPIIASLGNPDFASAYLGMCAPVAAWGALWKRWQIACRVLSGLVLLMCLAGALLSKAVQGPLAAAAGLAMLAAAVLLEHGGVKARRGLALLGAAAALGVALLLAGAGKVGPAAPIFRRSSFQARQFYWDAALVMFRRHPLTGVGLEHYGAYWRQTRSDEATRVLGGTSYSDAAHSVPLQMLAQGGLVLGLAYLALVAAVAVALVRGLRRLDGPPRLLLGGVGGVWVAYVVSAAVSIDQVPLVTIHFATAGAVVAIAGIRWRTLSLPGALRPDQATVRRRGRPPVIRERSMTGADLAGLSVATVIALTLCWFALVPFRASAANHRGDLALARGDGTAALAAYKSATRLFPGESAYWGKLGSLYEQARQPALALAAYRTGTQHDALDPGLLLNTARLAQDQGQMVLAARSYAAALALDPTEPTTVLQAAAYEAGHGQAAEAARALERAIAANAPNAELWAALGGARRVNHDIPGARAAYDRALAIQPDLANAKIGLQNLPA